MKRALRTWAAILLFCLPLQAMAAVGTSDLGPDGQDVPRDDSSREFIMSCTYGVLAGTLVGAASLAFTAHPGDNLNHIARGASLGLYAGILLGLYVIYIVPGLDEPNPNEDPLAMIDRVPLRVAPMFNPGLAPDGLRADYTLLKF